MRHMNSNPKMCLIASPFRFMDHVQYSAPTVKPLAKSAAVTISGIAAIFETPPCREAL